MIWETRLPIAASGAVSSPQAAATAAFKQAGDDHIGIAIFEHTRVQDDFYQTVADDHAVIRPHGGQHLADSPKVSFFVQRAAGA